MDNVKITEIEGYEIIEYPEKNIYVIEKILDDELCKDLINVIDLNCLDKLTYFKNQNVKCYISQLENLLEESDELYYSFSTEEFEYKRIITNINDGNLYTNNLHGLCKNDINKILNEINAKTRIMQKIFSKINNTITLKYNSGFTLRKIYGKTRIHSDGPNSGMNRKTGLKYINDQTMDKLNVVFIRELSCIFALNDDFTGGMIRFPEQNVNIKFTKGSVVCFPPFWTHPHEVSEIDNDKYRYTISTWFCNKHEIFS